MHGVRKTSTKSAHVELFTEHVKISWTIERQEHFRRATRFNPLHLPLSSSQSCASSFPIKQNHLDVRPRRSWTMSHDLPAPTHTSSGSTTHPPDAPSPAPSNGSQPRGAPSTARPRAPLRRISLHRGVRSNRWRTFGDFERTRISSVVLSQTGRA